LAIEHALKYAESDDPIVCHLELLSEAIDALADRTYGAAIELAAKSLSEKATGPARNSESIVSLRARFENLKRRPFPK